MKTDFKEEWKHLNPYQMEAVLDESPSCVVNANVGSGKTTVLVTRLGYMIHCRAIPPERILTVTYTVAATRDMRARFVSFFGEKSVEKLTFRTINSLCAAIIKYYVQRQSGNAFDLLSDERRIKGVLRDLLVRTGIPFPNDLQITDASCWALSRIGYRVLNSWYVIGIFRFLSGRKDEHGR